MQTLSILVFWSTERTKACPNVPVPPVTRIELVMFTSRKVFGQELNARSGEVIRQSLMAAANKSVFTQEDVTAVTISIHQ
jgi:hypothetical protein